MGSNPAHALLRDLRSYGPALLAQTEDPHAELLAMVWSSRFDREHLHALLRRQGEPASALFQPLGNMADCYDGMPSRHQQRLRRLIARHRARGTPWLPIHNRSQT